MAKALFQIDEQVGFVTGPYTQFVGVIFSILPQSGAKDIGYGVWIELSYAQWMSKRKRNRDQLTRDNLVRVTGKIYRVQYFTVEGNLRSIH